MASLKAEYALRRSSETCCWRAIRLSYSPLRRMPRTVATKPNRSVRTWVMSTGIYLHGPPNGAELSCPAEAGNSPLLYGPMAGETRSFRGPARRVSFSELLGATQGSARASVALQEQGNCRIRWKGHLEGPTRNL